MGTKQAPSAVTTVAHWAEWKEKCAAGLCSAEAQAAFRCLGRTYYEWHRRKLGAVHRDGATIVGGECGDDSPDAWHILETYAIVPRPKSAKLYKDYILSSAILSKDNPAAACQTAAGLVMRSALREYALRECADTRADSLYEPRGDGVALIDVLLPEADGAFGPGEEQELRVLAGEMAPGVFDGLNQRQRVFLLATVLGVSSLADPRVSTAAGCSYQRLYEAKTTIRDAIIRAIGARFPADSEDPSAITLLGEMISRALCPLTLAWGKAEKTCAPLFTLAGMCDL
jgi:hypothetical protein